MQAHRHLPGQAFSTGLKARLRGHDRDDGVPGTSQALSRDFVWAIKCAFTGRNRRGRIRQSVRWKRSIQLLDAVPIERPRITEVRRRRVVA
jgi:hypothetical protein